MDVCIDIGNTRAKIAQFEKGKLRDLIYRKSASGTWLSNYIKKNNVKRLILSTTRFVSKTQQAVLDRCEDHYVLTHDLPLPIKLKYKTPQTLGKDRIAAAVGAQAIFPNRNCLIIDAGTCITSDILDAKGNYLGGSIAPGLNMRLEAMNHFTSALPLIERKPFNKLLGKSTEESLLAGSMGATVKELDGFIDYYRAKYDKLQVLLTGGDTAYFDKYLENEIFAVPNLVLQGLYTILEFNAK